MKKLIVGAAAVLLLATGCAGKVGLGARDVKLPDGRMVTCVFYGQGLSCDWGNAK